MDTLVWLLFESPPALGAVLAPALFVLLAYWRRTLRPRPLVIGLGVSAVLLTAQAAVVTLREHAGRVMRRIELDVLASQTEAIAAALSQRFHVAATGWDREAFLKAVRRYMTRVDVRTLRRRRLEIPERQDGRFVIHVSYLADVATTEFSQPVLTRWRITLVREAGQWRILTLEPTELDHRPTDWRGIPAP